MAESTIDYQAVFRTLPGVLALLTPEGVILDVNDGFLEAAGREFGQILGRNLFDAFPENPDDPGDASRSGMTSKIQAGPGISRSATGQSSTRLCVAKTVG